MRKIKHWNNLPSGAVCSPWPDEDKALRNLVRPYS